MSDKRIISAKDTVAATSSSSEERQKAVAMDASKGKTIQETAKSEPNTSNGVAAMVGRLKLTSKEAKTLILDDADESIFGGLE
jgi:hypothetical protein